jgi:hypothetical protein
LLKENCCGQAMHGINKEGDRKNIYGKKSVGPKLR